MISGKFAITMHILTLLTKFPNEYLTSEFIAESINLHPVLVRKEIANLKQNNIVMSKEGKNGGTKLAIAPKNISLDGIFKLTFDKVTLGYAKNQPNPACPVGQQINKNLEELYENINVKINEDLKNITLEDFSNKF